MPAHFQSVIDRASKKIAKNVLSALGLSACTWSFLFPNISGKIGGFNFKCVFFMAPAHLTCIKHDMCVSLSIIVWGCKKEIEG